jgi:NADH dehydrogenase (ubiquinone) 1 beta subcomplex subunit 8
VHEDNDILGVFTPEEYTHVSSGKALTQLGAFIGAVCTLAGTVYFFYPDKPSAPRTFEKGLDTELGGAAAKPARKAGEDESW